MPVLHLSQDRTKAGITTIKSVHVSTHLSPIAKPEEIEFVEILLKTRSGKIMQRVFIDRAQGLPKGDLSTWDD